MLRNICRAFQFTTFDEALHYDSVALNLSIEKFKRQRDDLYSPQSAYSQPYIEARSVLAGLPSPTNTLELGCGTGIHSDFLVLTEFRVKKIEFIQMDLGLLKGR